MKMQCIKINVNEICNVERAVSGKTYKAGTCFIKLSAVNESVGWIREPGTIDSGYAALEPKADINTAYLYIAISRAFPDFLRQYRTTINLQFDTLKHFVIDWHDDEDAQAYVADQIGTVDSVIEYLENMIEREKEMKRWYLSKMMV